MSKAGPLISVIMSVYNTDKFVSEAIESILNQTCSDFEFIIIDDASTDRSLEFIRSYEKSDSRIKVITNEENLGVSKSRNKGVKAAKGEFIAVMDSDDVSLPDRFVKQVGFLERNPTVGVLGTNYMTINEKGGVLDDHKVTLQSSRIWWGMFFANQVVHPSVMMRHSIFTNHDVKYLENMTEDYDLWFQILPQFEIANLPESLHLYRLHGHNISIAKKDEQAKQVTSILKHRTEQILNMVLPDGYGAYIKNSSLIIPRREAVTICRALSKLYQLFKLRYPGISPEDKLFVENDYHKRLRKIINSQHNKFTLFPYYYWDLLFRMKRKFISRFASVSKNVRFEQKR